MKKVLYIMLLLIPLVGFGQIKKIQTSIEENTIGSLPDRGLGVMELIKYESDSSTVYELLYKNLKYMDINDYSTFHFEDTGGDLNALYSMIIDGFTTQPKENKIRLDIGNGNTLILEYRSNFRIISMRFYHINKLGLDSWSQWLSKKQLIRLFDKNNLSKNTTK